MPSINPATLARLQEIFRSEARERAEELSAQLLVAESSPTTEQAGEAVLRAYSAAHSLKGAARAAARRDIEALCHALEDRLGRLRDAPMRLAESADLLRTSVRMLERLLTDEAASASLSDEIQSLRGQLTAALATGTAGKPEGVAPLIAEPPMRRRDHLRLDTDQAQLLLDEAESLYTFSEAWHGARSELAQAGQELTSLRQALQAGRASDAVEAVQLQVADLERRLVRYSRAEAERHDGLRRHVASLLGQTQRIVLQPVSNLFEQLPAQVRDLAQACGKQLELVFEGQDLQVDRRLIEAMADPLMHLLRNAVDHGIETPGERRAQGKPERGRLCVRAARMSAGWVSMTVEDDGRGVQVDALRAAALPGSPLGIGDDPEAEVLALVCAPGLSTRQQADLLSGRGLGMAAVRDGVERVGGRLRYTKPTGGGCRWELQFPVTSSRVRVLRVTAGSMQLGLPSNQAQRAIPVRGGDLVEADGQAVLPMDGIALPVIDLAVLLGSPARPHPPEQTRPALLAGTQERRILLVVDAIEGEEELIQRPLGHPLKRLRGIAGVALPVTGGVLPILHMPDLLAKAARTRTRLAPVQPDESAGVRPRILLAEDSITSRMLLTTLLEAAGYRVHAVCDGLEAVQALQSGRFDLIVSDVDMPRLDGFSLTSKVREDERWSGMPVVLVTALETERDRDHGLRVGADAYLMKSEFDNELLLQTIRRLL